MNGCFTLPSLKAKLWLWQILKNYSKVGGAKRQTSVGMRGGSDCSCDQDERRTVVDLSTLLLYLSMFQTLLEINLTTCLSCASSESRQPLAFPTFSALQAVSHSHPFNTIPLLIVRTEETHSTPCSHCK